MQGQSCCTPVSLLHVWDSWCGTILCDGNTALHSDWTETKLCKMNACSSLSTETAPSILPEYIQNTTVSLSTLNSVLPEYLLLLKKVYILFYYFIPRDGKSCNVISLPNQQNKMKNITGLGSKGSQSEPHSLYKVV